jgi:DNA modification methylase
MTTIAWTNATRNIAELQPYQFNPRKISPERIELLKKSVLDSGYNAPIIIDADNTIIAGHQRWHCLKELGFTEVDVRVPSQKLSEEQFKRINIQDNLDFGDWDINPLLEAFDRDALLEWGFDESLLPKLEAEEGLVDDDTIPDLEAEPTAKPGDLYLLGVHRLLCGDSTVASDVERLLDGQSPNTMITDPPYGVSYNGDYRARILGRQKSDKDNSGKIQGDSRSDWYDAYVLFPGNVAYVWHASSFSDVVMDGLKRSGFEIKQQIIWFKSVHSLGQADYHWQHEPCWYAVKPGQDRNWKGGRNQMTVWNIPSILHCDKADKTSHPTQKPVEIYTKALENHTNPGEYVYDPFGGSGTLIIACEKLGRRAMCMELDPRFVDVIVKRWEIFTGNKAELITQSDL